MGEYYNLTLAIIVLCGMILVYGFIKLFKMRLEQLIEHKIKVHNVSMLSIINKCDKVIQQSSILNKSAEEYVKSHEKKTQELERLLRESMSLNEDFIKQIKNNSSK